MKRALLFLLVVSNAAAVELHVQFGALERMLAESVFTQEGRRYVKGSKENKCNFAYLEKPQVRGENGRLRMKARFSGRSTVNLAGLCVGMGVAFDVVILALPIYKGGNVMLQDVRVSSDGKTGFYIKRVCAAMEASLARDFKYPLERETQVLLENPAAQPNYKREVRKFDVREIRVSSDALVLQVDFELTVK
ncbi:MAG TPA: hypothetical protein VKE70_09635 [Candidatus Solibacter sp.]|nr:hypothetical protein [Candidatus Solibacter sp.]